MQILRSVSTALLAMVMAVPGWAAELVMVEQEGCHYCAQWNAAIGPIYGKTSEGRFAPLRRVDLHQPVPEDLRFDSKVVFTPTFILVEDGQELARIEGYPGEELFWWMLAKLLADETEFEGGPS